MQHHCIDFFKRTVNQIPSIFDTDHNNLIVNSKFFAKNNMISNNGIKYLFTTRVFIKTSHTIRQTVLFDVFRVYLDFF